MAFGCMRFFDLQLVIF